MTEKQALVLLICFILIWGGFGLDLIIWKIKRSKAMNICKYCENYIEGIKCDSINCDLKKIEKENTVLKEENKELKKQVADLKLEKSYMINPNAIGDRHEMGC